VILPMPLPALEGYSPAKRDGLSHWIAVVAG